MNRAKQFKALLCFLMTLSLTLSDIRLENYDLSAAGTWRISLNQNFLMQQQKLNRPHNDFERRFSGQRPKPMGKFNHDRRQYHQFRQSQQSQQKQQRTDRFNIFQHINTKGGRCYLFFYDSVLYNQVPGKQNVDSLSIRFHAPKYIDEKVIALSIPLLNYTADTDSWQEHKIKVNYTYLQNMEIKRNGTIKISYSVQKGQISLKIRRSIVNIVYTQQIYSFTFPVIIIIYNLLILYLMHKVQKKDISIDKLSIISLYHCIFFMIYMAIFFIIIGMATLPKSLALLGIAGIIQLIISIKLIKTFENIRQRISNFNQNCVFYCSIFVCIWLLFSYYYLPAFIIGNSLFLIPQIIHSIRYGNILGDQKEYLAILVSNQVYFLYLKGYPENQLKYHPEPWVCGAIILSVGLQIWFIWMQNKSGPFFFLKKQWLPNYFQYYKTFRVDQKIIFDKQCSICLEYLCNQDPQTVADRLNVDNLQQVKIHIQQTHFQLNGFVILMQTPCNHRFHPKCLETWMEHKRLCPIDRNPLPLLYK